MGTRFLRASLLLVWALTLTGCGSEPEVEICDLGSADSIEAGGKVNLDLCDLSPGNATIKWELSGSGDLNGEDTATPQYIAPPSIANDETITIKVTATDKAGRTASDSVSITVMAGEQTTTQTEPPLTPGQVKITITEPSDSRATCSEPFPKLCTFKVGGKISGVTDVVVRIWVQPTDPPGTPPGAWYLQESVGRLSTDGEFEVSTVQIGNPQYPAKTGDTLKIVAWVVTEDISGKLNDELDRAVLDPEGIVKLPAKSEEVELEVQR